MKAKIDEISMKVNQIHKCIYMGNGMPSMVTRIKLLEVAVAKHGSNWAKMIEALIRDVMIGIAMYFLLK